MVAEIKAAPDDIAALERDLSLAVTEPDMTAPDMTAKLASVQTVDWADLVDSTSTALKRHGLVKRCLAEALDEHIKRFFERATTVLRLYGTDSAAN